VDLDHFKRSTIHSPFRRRRTAQTAGSAAHQPLRATDVLVRVGGDELRFSSWIPIGLRSVGRRTADRELDQPSSSIPSACVSGPASASRARQMTRPTARDCCVAPTWHYEPRWAAPYETYRREVDDDATGCACGRVARCHPRRDLECSTSPDRPRHRERSAMELWCAAHERLGLIPPLDFIPLAEEAGSCIADRTRPRAGVEQCAPGVRRTDADHVGQRLRTNLLDAGFSGSVMATLARHDVGPESLILEITETTIIRDFDLCKLVIAQLRDLGSVSPSTTSARVHVARVLGSLAASELSWTGASSPAWHRRHGTKRCAGSRHHRARSQVEHARGRRGIEDLDALNLLTAIGCDLARATTSVSRCARRTSVLHPRDAAISRLGERRRLTARALAT